MLALAEGTGGQPTHTHTHIYFAKLYSYVINQCTQTPTKIKRDHFSVQKRKYHPLHKKKIASPFSFGATY